MVNNRMSIDDLIEIVTEGGKVKTGVDVFNSHGVLLLDKSVTVDRVKTLQVIKDNGIQTVPLSSSKDSGVWDKSGNPVNPASDGSGEMEEQEEEQPFTPPSTGEIEKKLYEIEELKKTAKLKYDEAKTSIRKVLGDIQKTGGEFDYDEVSKNVGDMVEFLTVNDNPFSYLTKEIFTYDEYLYNHSVNVCTIGTAILHRFNSHFSNAFNDFLDSGGRAAKNPYEEGPEENDDSFVFFQKEEMQDISLGFFLHDLGKVMVSEDILNKNGALTTAEFDEVKKHTFEHGIRILEKNRIKNSVLHSIVKYHHAPLFRGEDRCYPGEKHAGEIPVYVKVCKLADMYDAMTSKRCYKEAFNPINVVTELFRKYARKNRILQFLLHSFVKSIGIYPPGSIVFMRNGQMAYILESTGPLVLPFTDDNQAPLSAKPDPLDISVSGNREEVQIDHRRSVQTPAEVYDMLPSYLKEVVSKSAD